MTNVLKDKIALITGAASGIGRATAQLFAQEGAKVVLADMNVVEGHAATSSIVAKGSEAIFVPTDVRKMEDIRALVGKSLERYGTLDIVFSNAGMIRPGSATELSEEDWDSTLDVNLKAAWRLAKFAIPPMLARGGIFMTTSSITAIEGLPGMVAYQAAKGGLVALTRALAADYAPTVRCHSILPGGVETGMWSNLSKEQRAERAKRIPLRRNGQPEDIANVALFLASDMSSYMTATCLVVDGGRTAMELNWPK